MKKTWMLAVALLALTLPAAGMAQGLPDFLSAAGEGIAQGVEAVSQSLDAELELTMTADGTRIEEGQTRVVTLTAVNPRAVDTPRASCARASSGGRRLPRATAATSS